MPEEEAYKDTLYGWGRYPKVKTTEKPLSFSAKGQKKIYRGLGRSYGDEAVAENGLTLNTTSHNRILDFNSSTGLVKVQSGVSLQELMQVFIPKGFMPMVCPGTQYVTVGGAIANDIHGKGHHVDGSFINTVKSFELVLANGELIKCSRLENTELFFANAGGCGLLGFISTAEMWLRPIKSSYFTTQSFYANSIDQMLDLLDTEGLQWHYTVGWVDTLKPKHPGVLVVGKHHEPNDKESQKLDLDNKAPFSIPDVFPNGLLNGISIPALNKIIEFQQKRVKGVSHYKPFFFPLDALANWNVGYGSNGFIQFQFVVPLQNGHQNIKLVLKAIDASGCKPFLNVIKRFGNPSGKYLSFPITGYTLALDFAVNQKVLRLCKHLNHLIGRMGGRVYLAKDATLNANDLKLMYGNELKEWMDIKTQVDPNNQFASALAQRLNIS